MITTVTSFSSASLSPTKCSLCYDSVDRPGNIFRNFVLFSFEWTRTVRFVVLDGKLKNIIAALGTFLGDTRNALISTSLVVESSSGAFLKARSKHVS